MLRNSDMRLFLFSVVYVACVFLFISLFYSPVVRAHTGAITPDEAAWIEANARHCCGPRDCVPVYVEESAAGYRIKHPTVAGLWVVAKAEQSRPGPSGRDLACFIPEAPPPALGDHRVGCLFLGPRA